MSDAKTDRVRVVVVGVAGIGKTHVRLLGGMAEAHLVGVCDVSEQALSDLHTHVPKYSDYSRMLVEARPHAVILATPPAAHAGLTEQAAAAGIHVFAEKPMAESVASAQRMIDSCGSADVVLMIGHKKRFVGAYARLHELLERDLGPAQLVVYRYVHPGRSEKDWFWDEADGGGPLRENAIHAADTLRWLCGEVVRVQGEGDVFTFEDRAPQTNCAVMTLRFDSGAIASLTAGMVGTAAMPTEDLYVTTARGIAEVSGAFDNPVHLRWALRGARNLRAETFSGDPFVRELEQFFHCIRTGDTPLTNGEEGLRSLELTEWWKQAVQTTG